MRESHVPRPSVEVREAVGLLLDGLHHGHGIVNTLSLAHNKMEAAHFVLSCSLGSQHNTVKGAGCSSTRPIYRYTGGRTATARDSGYCGGCSSTKPDQSKERECHGHADHDARQRVVPGKGLGVGPVDVEFCTRRANEWHVPASLIEKHASGGTSKAPSSCHNSPLACAEMNQIRNERTRRDTPTPTLWLWLWLYSRP